MLELRCNIAPDEAYFYTKHIVKRWNAVSGRGERGEGGLRRVWQVREAEERGRKDAYIKLAGITIKIDFKPHV